MSENVKEIQFNKNVNDQQKPVEYEYLTNMKKENIILEWQHYFSWPCNL